MNENDFNTNYELSRRLGSITEEFGADLLSLANNTCKARLKGVAKWKVDMLSSDCLLGCMELFYDISYKINNPINFFHTAIDNLALKYVTAVYELGTQDAFRCSLVINKNNGTQTGKRLVAKQINDNDGYID